MGGLRIQDWKLKHKVIFHIFIIGAISGSLLLFVHLGSVGKVVEAVNSRKTALVSTLILDRIRHALSLGNPPTIGPFLADVTATRAVERVRILDLEGRILHSSAAESPDASIPRSERSRLREQITDPGREETSGVWMVGIDRGFLRIENRPECQRCHDPAKPLLGILDVKFDMSEEAAVLSRTQKAGIGIAIASLILIAFVTYRLYAKIIEKPLTRLMDSMRRVADGDLSPRLTASRKDEFGTLARSFNAMTDRLQEAGREAERHRDLELERAGHLASLGELAAGLAHEIRNPIAGIIGAAEIGAEQSSADDRRKSVFEEIHRQAGRINGIVQNLLNFSRPREVVLRRENPNDAIRGALRMAEHQTVGKSIRFRFVPLPEHARAEIDGAKMEEVVLNLLLNAIAAVDRDGEISVAAVEADGRIEIRVADTGNGIVPQHLPLIFNPFFTTRKAGTGLGLSLCKQIIEAHGGTIGAESELGRGSVFTIRIPAAPGEKAS